MGILKYAFVVLFVCAACEEELVELEETGEKSRTLVDNDFRQNRWRAVEPLNMGASGWISNDPPLEDPKTDADNIPKRRRLRKRKRRPQIIPLIDENSPTSTRRIRRPPLPHENKPWKEMEEESRMRPNKRRRIIPVYMDEENQNISQHLGFGDRESVKTPEVEVYQADEATSEGKKIFSDLKKLLKQAGGSSLSEILQQKNLSLSDLLTGQKQAILALTDKPPDDVITEYKNPVDADDYQKPTSNEVHRENSNENVNVKGRDNTVYGVDIEDTVTERIFVPSHPKYYTSLDYKPSIIKVNLFGSEATPKPNASDAKEEKSGKTKANLPITNAQLQRKTRPETSTTAQTYNLIDAYKINITDLFGFEDLMKQQQENDTVKKNEDEGPLRMSIDLNEISESEVKQATTEKVASTTMVVPEKLKAITAKDEIMEILQDEAAKQNLSKILATRNMTIEELVEQRERGSSQRHLADIFHNKTKEPEPKDEAHVGQVIPMTYTYKPITYFERKPKSHPLPLEIKKDSEGDSYITSVDAETIEDSNESKSVEESKDRNKYTVTSFPMYKIEMDKKFKDDGKSVLPLWKAIYPINKDVILDDAKLQNLDIVESTISEAVNDKLNVDVDNNEVYDDDDYEDSLIKLPYGVKSAILASLLIIGSSLLLFLTILMVFKWSQRHKKKLCYTNSWSCSKIKSPILDGTPKRSIKNFMFETLGRSKVYYKQPLKSSSDSIWDNDKKPFQ